MSTAQILVQAAKFARCLDENDFPGAAEYLRPDCLYLYDGKALKGPAEILGSYEANYLKGKERFDEIVFESEVEQISDSMIRVNYLDRLRKGEAWLEHRAQQELHFDDERICRIVHVDLPEERERLRAFLG